MTTHGPSPQPTTARYMMTMRQESPTYVRNGRGTLTFNHITGVGEFSLVTDADQTVARKFRSTNYVNEGDALVLTATDASTGKAFRLEVRPLPIPQAPPSVFDIAPAIEVPEPVEMPADPEFRATLPEDWQDNDGVPDDADIEAERGRALAELEMEQARAEEETRILAEEPEPIPTDFDVAMREEPAAPSVNVSRVYESAAEPEPEPVEEFVSQQQADQEVRASAKPAKVNRITVHDPTPYMVTEAPAYIASGDEYADAMDDIRNGENVLICGPTGCGKTVLLQNVAVELNKPLVTVNCQEGATSEHLLGQRDVEVKDGASYTHFVAGLIVKAAEMGAMLYLDEFNMLPDGLRGAVYALMDHRRETTLAEDRGRVVKAAPGFVVVASMNEGFGYNGTSRMSDAVRQRFKGHYTIGYLPKVKEVSLLVKRTSLDRSIAEDMVEVAGRLRAQFDDGECETPVSTRMVLAWAAKVARGRDPKKAAEATIIGAIPVTESAEREAFRDVVSALFM